MRRVAHRRFDDFRLEGGRDVSLKERSFDAVALHQLQKKELTLNECRPFVRRKRHGLLLLDSLVPSSLWGGTGGGSSSCGCPMGWATHLKTK